MGKEEGTDLENNGDSVQETGVWQQTKQSAKLIALVFCLMRFHAKTWF